jgi:hypothetical protein
MHRRGTAVMGSSNGREKESRKREMDSEREKGKRSASS